MARRAGASSVLSLLSIAIATLPIARLSCPVTLLNTYKPNGPTASEPIAGDRRRADPSAGLRVSRLPAVGRIPCAPRARPAERTSLVLPRAHPRIQQEVGLFRRPRRRGDRVPHPRRYDLAATGLAARRAQQRRLLCPYHRSVRPGRRRRAGRKTGAPLRWQRATDSGRAQGL